MEVRPWVRSSTSETCPVPLPDGEPQVPAADPVLVPVGSWAGAVRRQSQAGFFLLLTQVVSVVQPTRALPGLGSVRSVMCVPLESPVHHHTWSRSGCSVLPGLVWSCSCTGCPAVSFDRVHGGSLGRTRASPPSRGWQRCASGG